MQTDLKLSDLPADPVIRMSFNGIMSSISQFLSETVDFFGHHPIYAAAAVGVAVLAAAYFKFNSD